MNDLECGASEKSGVRVGDIWKGGACSLCSEAVGKHVGLSSLKGHREGGYVKGNLGRDCKW